MATDERMLRPLLAGSALAFLLLAVWWLWPSDEPPPAPDPIERPTRVAVPSPPIGTAEDEPPEPLEVECELAEELGEHDRLVLSELDPDSLQPIASHEPEVEGLFFTFRPARAAGLGMLSTRRHRPKPMAWVEGACTGLVELERLPSRVVSGHAEGPIEVGAVAVHAECRDEPFAGFSGSLTATGAFRMEIPADQPCSLVLTRVFAGRDLVSEPVPVPGNTEDVDGLVLEVPAAPGHGMGLYPSEGGLRVYDIDPDSPAARAGLRRQDLVVAVDGEPASEVDLDLVQRDERPMRLELVRDGEILELTVR